MYSTWTALLTAVAHQQIRSGSTAALVCHLDDAAPGKSGQHPGFTGFKGGKARSDRPYTKTDWEYWMLRARDKYSHAGHQDRGLFAFLLLNLVQSATRRRIASARRVLHSYLEGAGVELMANSKQCHPWRVDLKTCGCEGTVAQRYF